MEHIQLQLKMSSLDHLSLSVSTPRYLKALLIGIQNHLPQFIQFPYDQRRESWKIYQILAITTVLDKGQYLVIV